VQDFPSRQAFRFALNCFPRLSKKLSFAIYMTTYWKGYRRCLHEINPYTEPDRSAFYANHGQSLWDDLVRINRFVEKHFISISGEGFFCVLRDNVDGSTKVMPLSRQGSSMSA
jgi:hypothetical protein